MSDGNTQTSLEAARARLEAALSALTQGVIGSREALDDAATVANEKALLVEKNTALEQENLKLHEQVAAYALQPDPSSAAEKLAGLTEANAALENNIQMLKLKCAQLQDQLDAQTQTIEGGNSENELLAENLRLRQVIAQMTADKDAIKSELDTTIADFETLLEDA